MGPVVVAAAGAPPHSPCPAPSRQAAAPCVRWLLELAWHSRWLRARRRPGAAQSLPQSLPRSAEASCPASFLPCCPASRAGHAFVQTPAPQPPHHQTQHRHDGQEVGHGRWRGHGQQQDAGLARVVSVADSGRAGRMWAKSCGWRCCLPQQNPCFSNPLLPPPCTAAAGCSPPAVSGSCWVVSPRCKT